MRTTTPLITTALAAAALLTSPGSAAAAPTSPGLLPVASLSADRLATADPGPCRQIPACLAASGTRARRVAGAPT
ncbi:hypothetical protein [Streptomyces justiciae]|uniref:hypothetical protein n=1 Tax=Streptomyces justiciae TaxID=2780140 RepID=UPI001882EA13|nr:hypothetical protein [Streptomyces justiciae]MBE8477685.1 hypothetical protein [Streptomyces justiciae]